MFAGSAPKPPGPVDACPKAPPETEAAAPPKGDVDGVEGVEGADPRFRPLPNTFPPPVAGEELEFPPRPPNALPKPEATAPAPDPAPPNAPPPPAAAAAPNGDDGDVGERGVPGCCPNGDAPAPGLPDEALGAPPNTFPAFWPPNADAVAAAAGAAAAPKAEPPAPIVAGLPKAPVAVVAPAAIAPKGEAADAAAPKPPVDAAAAEPNAEAAEADAGAAAAAPNAEADAAGAVADPNTGVEPPPNAPPPLAAAAPNADVDAAADEAGAPKAEAEEVVEPAAPNPKDAADDAAAGAGAAAPLPSALSRSS